jgi:hypothetical protein
LSLASVSRPALGPTQSPVQWVPGVLSSGLKRGRGVTLTTHPHLVPMSRMSRSYTSSPPSAYVACSGTALAFNLQNSARHFYPYCPMLVTSVTDIKKIMKMCKLREVNNQVSRKFVSWFEGYKTQTCAYVLPLF